MTLFIILSMSPAVGKDLYVLIRILYAAFEVEQMSAICMNANITLSDGDKELSKTAGVYSEGIKRHVIRGLDGADVSFVLRSAADRAKADTQAEIKALAVYSPEQLPIETLHWCVNKVRPLANQILGVYYRHPETIEQLIAKAKAD